MELSIVLAPFLASLLAFICRPLLGNRHGPLISVLIVSYSAVAAIFVAYDCLMGHNQVITIVDWFSSGTLSVSWSLKIDQTSAMMLVVVTVVSTLVHLYSLDYMRDDSRRDMFFGNISLFTGFMLMLVTANNLLQLYFGWEGVGLSSYLLINHWYERKSAGKAAIKSFIVNRVGDFGFCIGLLAVFLVFGSFDFDTIFSGIPAHSGTVIPILGKAFNALNLICLLLFLGAMAKSAQLGLHVWLPDAMEAPTPVSALIHAATMVTAGVFMLVRLSPLFQAAPFALEVIIIVGALTAFVAATIAVTQFDIKRIIAYSTMSQLGFMIVACGVSATDAAMFHLFTHAFFKALLFLGAGVVIHSLAGEQDIRRMGGLARSLPLTAGAMAIGSLALSGIPGFSGFFSKEAILAAVQASDRPGAALAFALLVVTVPLTAFYSWRLMFTVFLGGSAAKVSHGHDHHHGHGHGSAALMLVTVVVLTGLTLVSGVVGRLSPHYAELPAVYGYLVIALAVAGIFGALIACVLAPSLQGQIARSLSPIDALLRAKWGFDILYDRYLVAATFNAGRSLALSVEDSRFNGLFANKITEAVWRFARGCVRIQTGFIEDYAVGMIAGIAILILWSITMS